MESINDFQIQSLFFLGKLKREVYGAYIIIAGQRVQRYPDEDIVMEGQI